MHREWRKKGARRGGEEEAQAAAANARDERRDKEQWRVARRDGTRREVQKVRRTRAKSEITESLHVGTRRPKQCCRSRQTLQRRRAEDRRHEGQDVVGNIRKGAPGGGAQKEERNTGRPKATAMRASKKGRRAQSGIKCNTPRELNRGKP